MSKIEETFLHPEKVKKLIMLFKFESETVARVKILRGNRVRVNDKFLTNVML